MGFFFNKESRSSLPNIGYPGTGHDFWYSVLNSPYGGQVAEGIASAYACKLAISESVSMLPAITYREDGELKAHAKESYLYSLIRDQPNPFMSSFDFFESQQNSLLDHGNSYSFLAKNKFGAIREIRPLKAEQMEVKPLPDGGIGYVYNDNGVERRYAKEDILHVRYNSLDGITGRPPSRVCKLAFDYAHHLEKHGKNLFEKGGFMSAMLEVPQDFKFQDRETARKFLNSFKEGLFGSNNYAAVGMLEHGIKLNPFKANNKDHQFFELQEFSVKNIARIYRVPPVMIAVTESGMSYASIEQLAIMWVQYTIQPWVTRWERSFKWQVFARDTQSTPDDYLKFNIKALLRGDLKNEIEAIAKQIEFGLKTVNEARKLVDENPSNDPIADKLLISHNLLQGQINEQAN